MLDLVPGHGGGHDGGDAVMKVEATQMLMLKETVEREAGGVSDSNAVGSGKRSARVT